MPPLALLAKDARLDDAGVVETPAGRPAAAGRAEPKMRSTWGWLRHPAGARRCARWQGCWAMRSGDREIEIAEGEGARARWWAVGVIGLEGRTGPFQDLESPAHRVLAVACL